MLGYSGGQEREITPAFAVGFHVSIDCISIMMSAFILHGMSYTSEISCPANEG